MAIKKDFFYYEIYKDVSNICVKAADYLVDCLTNYDPSKINEYLTTMHEFEHDADKKRHEMSKALSKAFITQIEREDLDQLSYYLDEVADSIEEVLQRFYIDDIKVVMDDSIVFAKKIADCANTLVRLFDEFPN